MGNDIDEVFLSKIIDLAIQNELYYRYADDINLALRSIGRKTKFCPEAGRMIDKSEAEMEAELHKNEDEITITEIRKIADTIQDNIRTEADYPSKHPELDMKVPVLDLSLWVEDVRVHAQGLEGTMLHSNCDRENPCLRIGEPGNHENQVEG